MNSPSRKLMKDLPPNHLDFSLVLGGPLFQLMRRAHLSDDALSLARRRILFISLFTWLPLLVLSAFDGQLLGGVAAVPFLKDFEAHVRFLVVLPLVIGAELIVHQRMRFVVRQFLDRELIPETALAQFDAAIEAAFRLRNSIVAEVLIVAFVYGVGVLVIWRQFMALDAATWYATPDAGGISLTIAGTWLAWVSLPIFQFLLCRWYFRLFIWGRFLWQVSRIPLQLVPTHPDRLGGLGFLSATAYAFMPLAMAHGAMLAGPLANRIFHLGATLLQFKVEIIALVVLLACVLFAPLLVFAPQLAAAKRNGIREYDTLAQQYVREFDTKWLRGGAPAGEPLVGSADIQSLADMGNSLEVVRSMRIAPISKDAIVQLAVATLIPVAPLLLTMMSLEDLLKKLFGILF